MRYTAMIWVALLMVAGSCHRRMVVDTVERTVTVRDTVRIMEEAKPVWQHPLDRVVEEALGHYPQLLKQSQVGVCIADLDRNVLLAARSEGQRLRTASAMKAVTAITALATVRCADSAFVTRVMTDGKRAWVRGGWDPLLSAADVTGLARQARASLPSTVTAGNGMAPGCPVAIDMSGQDEAHYGRGWCWDDHNPLLTPLFYAPATESRKRKPIARPEQDFADAFAAAWRKAPASKGASRGGQVLAAVCRPLSEVLAPMLKNSDNLMAEAVWRLTGETEAARQEALGVVAAAAGVEPGGLAQADGSGLSLYNYASPMSFVRLLFWADRQPFAPVLRQCMACMGQDGTLKNRSVRGARIEAKTGTVEGVITLVGYMTLTDGSRLAFAVMMNGVEDKGQARAATDYLLERVAESMQRR